MKYVDGLHIRLVMGTEIQTYIDYAMTVRMMDYDAVDYTEQMKEIQRSRESAPKENPLSVLRKEDRLTPILNLVLYLGEKPWDAENHMHGILDMEKVPEQLRTCIPDYNIKVLDIRRMSDERLLEFPDDIACMFLIIKYEKDAAMLRTVMQGISAFRNMGEDAYDTVWQFVSDHRMLEQNIRMENENGGVNMCKAIDDIYAEGKAEGKAGEIGIIRLMYERNMKTKAAAELLGFSDSYIMRIYSMFRDYPEENDMQIAARSL